MTTNRSKEKLRGYAHDFAEGLLLTADFMSFMERIPLESHDEFTSEELEEAFNSVVCGEVVLAVFAEGWE